jgi:hypothetical protein
MSRFITCGLTILLAFAPAALAVDGTVLINQSTITNGLTGCPTGGHFPIVICQPGSYRLSGNLTVDENTTAIQITASDVSVDLNGFAILGPVKCSFGQQCSTSGTGVGINSVFNNNVALSNGAVDGMGSVGIRLTLGNGSKIDGLRVANSASPSTGGFAGIIADGVMITNCTVFSNAGSGIAMRGGTESHNIVSSNGGFGIDGGNIAINNSLLANGQDGMKDVTLAVNNSMIENKGFGFTCSSGSSCSFEGNVFVSNLGGAVSGGTTLGHNSANGIVF